MKQTELPALERTIKRIKGNGEAPNIRISRALPSPELWLVHSQVDIKAFGRTFKGKEYVLAKTWDEARIKARQLTGYDVTVSHPDFKHA